MTLTEPSDAGAAAASGTPVATVPARPADWNPASSAASWDWDALPALPPLWRADGSAPAEQQTRVRLCADASALYVRFDCTDRDVWTVPRCRDDPLYADEVVELFLAAGADDPTSYAEIVVNPDGVVYDAWITNPTARGADLDVDVSWDCAGLEVDARHPGRHADWSATLVVPWAAVAPGGRPTVCRANLYRIERPRDGEPEFSCWSPTLTTPADFHRPVRFGTLRLSP